MRLKRYVEVPWKRNLLKIPNYILEKVENLKGKPVVISVLKKVKKSEIEKGIFSHIGIKFNKATLEFPNEFIPLRKIGRWSVVNLDGKRKPLKNLPMITKTFTMEAPNYNGNGTHDVSFDRPIYQKEYFPPKELVVKIELLGQEVNNEPIFIFKFTVDEVLTTTDINFEKNLIYNLNILQENVGAVDIYPSVLSNNEYLSTLYVNWEILPPGQRDQNINLIFGGGSKRLTPEQQERYDFLVSLNPRNLLRGTSKFHRYFGAQFGNDLVVLENTEYGNAIYVMGENWENLSKLSRTELLAKAQKDFIRILHQSDWKSQLKKIVTEYRAS
jgi:hypothetical protein